MQSGCLCRRRTCRGCLPVCRVRPCVRHRPLLLAQSLYAALVGERLDEGLRTARLKGRVAAFGAGIPTACPDPLFLGRPRPGARGCSLGGRIGGYVGFGRRIGGARSGCSRLLLSLQRLRGASYSLHRAALHSGSCDYIPYYKRLVRVGRDSVAAPVARRYYAYRLFEGASSTSSMPCPARLSMRRRRAVCSPRPGAAGTATGVPSRASPAGAASSLGCSRTRRCVWPT